MQVEKRRSAVNRRSVNNKSLFEIKEKMPAKKLKHAKNFKKDEMQSSFFSFVNFKSKLKNQMLEQFEDVIEEEKDEDEELDQLKDFLQKLGLEQSEWVDLDG